MSGLAIDDAAWSSRWRDRAVLDKGCLCIGLILAAALLPVWPSAPLIAAVALGLLLGRTGAPRILVWRAMRTPLVFIVVGCVSVALVVSVDGGLSVTMTQQSVSRASEVAAHAVAGTSAMLLLAMTTPMVDLMGGLRRMKVPHACVEVAGLTYRMLFILLESVGTIRESQAARLGYCSARHSLRSVGMLTAAVLTRSWDRARRLEQGLAGREMGRSMQTLDDPPASSPAFLAGSVALLLTLVAVALGWRGVVA